jgi:hypothetical protein
MVTCKEKFQIFCKQFNLIFFLGGGYVYKNYGHL